MKKILSVLLALIVGFSLVMPATMSDAQAATKGTADELVRVATSAAYVDKSLSGVKSAMKKNGYSLWNPNYTGDWCAWYVVNCARIAGIPASVIPNTTYASISENVNAGGIEHVSKARGGNYTPKKGDLIFFNWEPYATTEPYYWTHHIEIVVSVSGNTVKTVGGNSGNPSRVRIHSYALDSKYIKSYVTPNYPKTSYTVKYCTNGGEGSMSSTKHTYGVKSALRKNTFTRSGYIFAGWYVYRVSDGKWRYTDGTNSGWYKKGQQPSGYKLGYFADGAQVSTLTKVNNDTIKLYAKWKTAPTWTVKYNANGGTGSMASTKHTYGIKSYISKNTYTRDGYTFGGWYAHRVSDDTWRYGNGTDNGYYKKGQQPAGFELVPWNDHTWIWKTTTVNNDVIELYAKWDERPCHTWVEWTTTKPEGKLPNYTNVAVDNKTETAAVGETCYMTIQSDGMYPVYRYEFYLQKPGDSDFVLVGAYDAGEGKKLVCKGVPVTFEKAGTYKFKIKQFRREGGDWNLVYVSPNNNGSSRNITVK